MDDQTQEKYLQLCDLLELPRNSGLPVVRKSMTGYMDRLVRQPDHVFDESETERLETQIDRECRLFFDFCDGWYRAISKPAAASGQQDHVEALKLKNEAGAITRAYQKVLVSFLHARLFVNALKTALDLDIDKARQNTTFEYGEIRWTYDLPPQVALMTRKRNVLSGYMVRIRAAKPIVEKLEGAFDALEKALLELLGDAATRVLMENFTGFLRKHRLSDGKAEIENAMKKDLGRKICLDKKKRQAKWKTVDEIVATIIQCIEKTAPHLEGRGGRMFLRNWEIKLAYESMTKELQQAREFLAKYEVPEIMYRRDALDREEERLLKLLDFEQSLLLLEDLLKGRYLPLATLKDVRAFETGTLEKIHYVTEHTKTDIQRSRDKAEEFSCGPQPEDVPDEALFAGLEDRIPAMAS